MEQISREKEVFFFVYCPTCKYRHADETDEHCDRCLANPSNIDSHRPTEYVEE